MVCLVITRGGWGDVWRFASRDAAIGHALWHSEDALLAGAEDITRQYNMLEIGRLLEMIGIESLRVEVLSSVHPDLGLPDRVRLERVAERADRIWDGLLGLARDVPEDPAQVLELVRSDRENVLRTQNKEAHMADDKNKTGAAAGTTAAAAAPKAPKAKKFADTSVIRLQADKDGKKFGKDNNPKRAGTTTHDRFAKLVDGMTVAAYVKAVGNEAQAFSELDYNQKKGFLKIEEAGL